MTSALGYKGTDWASVTYTFDLNKKLFNNREERDEFRNHKLLALQPRTIFYLLHRWSR